jgi:predicted molibdopterin-dependent oxidoreductase YjgC
LDLGLAVCQDGSSKELAIRKRCFYSREVESTSRLRKWNDKSRGNLTYRTEGNREKTPDTFVEVSPELAEERGIQAAHGCS